MKRKKNINKKIVKIEVSKLFGFYNYVVDNSNNLLKDSPLLVIYGDNGSGKTTLLKMIFYLLSPTHNSGHKTSLSEIKFNSFKLVLNDSTVIYAVRPDKQIEGSFTVGIQEGSAHFEVELKVNSDGTIRAYEEPEVDILYQQFLAKISNLNIEINFLSENRKLLSFSNTSRNRSSVKNKLIRTNNWDHFIQGPEEEEEDTVRRSIKDLEYWLKSNALKGTKAGEENANTIYSKLLTQITTPKINSITKKQVNLLLEKIHNIGQKVSRFYESGLVSKIEVEEFKSALSTATGDNVSLIYNILEPYIEGIQGRLNSLEEVQDILSKFLASINDYFSHKTIRFTLSEGFSLTHNELQQPIDFRMLSSGEKQLLHLFCNVITSSERSTIFIIDEPEISLNIKWQRKLISTLLSFSTGNNVQFLFASHSIELLSSHRESVHKLTTH